MLSRIANLWRKPLIALTAAIAVMIACSPHPTQVLERVAVHTLAPDSAEAAAMSNYLQNKFLDNLLRAQAYTAPTTEYVALATSSSSAAACGTEVTGGSYTRVAVTAALVNWAGTQSAGSTTASSGTSGQKSNNGAITFPSPTANWGTVTGFCVFDASSGGNLLFFAALTVSKTVNNGDAAPSFAAAALTYTITYNMRDLFRHFEPANDEVFESAA